jgi:SET domain-containing protein
VSWNLAKYINHSCDPNCETDIIRGKIWINAIKDIKKGEELTYDYGYDMDCYEDHPCRCDSKNCVGYIVRSNLRWRVLRKIQNKKKK